MHIRTVIWIFHRLFQHRRDCKWPLKLIWYYPVRNNLFYVGDRYLAVLHTRLRLGNSTLNYDLYLKKCVPSPSCQCGFSRETIAHFFLDCDRYAAHRDCLLTSTAQFVGNERWSNASRRTCLHWLLNGSPEVSFLTNTVHKFLADCKHFSKSQ